MDIQGIRQQYPQYDDMSDFQIANALHQKFYSDMPVDKVYTALGVKPGYQDPTGKYVPIANAGQKAPDPGSAAAGTAAGVGNVVLGAANTVPRGLWELGGAIKGALTPGESADNTSQAWGENAPQIPSINPGSGAANQGANAAVIGAAGKVMNSIPQGLDWLYTKSRQAEAPLLQAQVKAGYSTPGEQAQDEARTRGLLDVGGNLASMAIGPKLFGSEPAVKPALEPAPIPEVTPLNVAHDAGYSIMPSEAAIKGGSAPMGKVVEGLAGSAKTGVDATVKNQAVTNRLAAQEIGAPAGTPLTDTVLDNLRKPLNAVYDKVSNLGQVPTDKAYLAEINGIGRTPGNSFPGVADPDIAALKQNYAVPRFDAGDAVLQIRNLRKNATANYKAASANQVKNAPMLGELADAQQGIADALENQLERFVGSPADKVGNPALIQQWRDARQGLAKINSVDNAIKEGTTDVSAPALAKQLNKGAPLSGNLKTIADAANAFPISVRDIGAVRNKVPINALEGLMGTGGIGAALLGSPHAAAGLAAGMIARPMARGALLSRAYQDALAGSGNPFLSIRGAPQLLGRAGAPLLIGGAAQNPLYGNALLTGTR